MKSRIYQFINQGVSRPQFFLLDADENLVFSSQTNEAMRESLQNSFHWRLVNNLPASAGKVAMVVARAEVGVSTVSSMLVGCCLYDEKGGVGGYLYFALDEDQMAAQFKQCASDLIVTDRFDSVFLGTNSAFVGDFGKLRVMLRDANGFTMLPEGLFYIRTLTTQNGFLKIHAMSECGGIISTLLLLGALVLVFFGVFTAVILVSTERVSRQKTRIIDEIAAACYQVQQGDLNTELSISSHDEFQIISQAYNSMLKSMRELIRRSVDLGHETAVSKIKQLESQFHPHFLFNTLNTLKWIATLNHVTPVSHGIDALSSLLQSTLIKKDELIPFDDELRNLKNYCDIQQLRYAGRFEMEYQIEDAAGYWTVPRFILQPLVENSILHGTADEDDFVTITVRATVSENLLTIHISDTGCGFDPSAIKEKNSERFSGIGLSNVDERMRLHYGNEYGLTIESAPGTGTQCILRIPNEAIR